jgi:hypothetical protein
VAFLVDPVDPVDPVEPVEPVEGPADPADAAEPEAEGPVPAGVADEPPELPEEDSRADVRAFSSRETCLMSAATLAWAAVA